MKFLGIDTSCYTTSAAIVDENENVLINSRLILNVSKGERGIRQSDAVFLHIKNMPEVFSKLNGIKDLYAAAASNVPRLAEGSYMPVFKVSESYAKTIASLNGIKCYLTSHQHGHLYAAMIGQSISNGEYLCAHVSGGTTEIFSADISGGIVNDIKHIGGTLDITCGQLIDRTGVLMGVDFPCGSHMEELISKECKILDVKPLPITVNGVTANLSGAETYADKYINQGIPKETISKLVFDCSSHTISKLLINAAEETGIDRAILFGGVCSSEYIKDIIKEELDKKGISTVFAKKEYSADNAAGIALMAKRLYFSEEND